MNIRKISLNEPQQTPEGCALLVEFKNVNPAQKQNNTTLITNKCTHVLTTHTHSPFLLVIRACLTICSHSLTHTVQLAHYIIHSQLTTPSAYICSCPLTLPVNTVDVSMPKVFTCPCTCPKTCTLEARATMPWWVWYVCVCVRERGVKRQLKISHNDCEMLG